MVTKDDVAGTQGPPDANAVAAGQREVLACDRILGNNDPERLV
jgi:hypothetical protein